MNSRAIRNLSLTTLPLSGLWFLSSPGYEPAITFITALGTAFAANHIGDRSTTQAGATPPPVEAETNQSSAMIVSDSYSKTVGTRLRWLRKKVLELSLREMAEFLGIEVISTLERFESGEEEYPLHLIKKIEEFFRINPRYVESGDGSIFLHFFLSQESVSSFVRDGYTPILACCPSEQGDLFCYQVFEKHTNGYCQIAFSDRYGSFSSSGGGKMNIRYLINALLDAGKTPSSVRILKATPEEWKAISNGSYYIKNPFSRFGDADWKCMDIFDSWFDEYAKNRAK